MDKKLLCSATAKFILGLVCTGALLFLPAGTIYFSNGWLLMAVMFLPMFVAGLVMMKANPALLRSRLQAKEQQGEQRLVVVLSGLMFLCGFVAAGLDFRFGWSAMPGWLPVCAAAVFLAAYGLYAEVLRENTWLSRTVRVQQGQQVVDTGLYGIVRHPMYAATVILFLSMPLVLGSWVSFVVFLVYPLLIVKRIRNEEQVLEAELNGYADYKARVKYRLIPYIW
ncbi:MAG: isoprenylcysteine carboxylmethyltransferase family protein [Oscillospiraceae bacterium]|nr:isoprenylcysteine carboxylmethyltransferase family protein [Oscillospiraceae bacterium]